MKRYSTRITWTALIAAMTIAGGLVPAFAAKTPAARTPAPSKTAKPVPPPPSAGTKTNPLLPPQIPIDGFYGDLALVAKVPQIAPQGFEPLYSGQDWQKFRDRFGVQADGVTRLKSSGQAAFADELVKAALSAGSPQIPTATAPAGGPATAPAPIALSGYSRLLLLRAAAIGYRNHEGFPVAHRAVKAYADGMDKKSPTQVGALWSIANTMARTSVTPKEDRIRYDGIAARANMQVALLLLQADQVTAADAITHQVAYHEGWLKSDPATRAKIAQVRAVVKQTGTMMDYLATQYGPAIHNDPQALLAVYLFGRYVKGKPEIVADLPGRIPGSTLAHLAGQIDAAERGDLTATFNAAEGLRQAAADVPDAVIRERTLYGALQMYDLFLTSKQTEHDRVHRTMAQIAREGVVADGAKRGITIDPFAKPAAPATAPSLAPAPSVAPNVAVAKVQRENFQDESAAWDAAAVRSVREEGHMAWRLDPATTAQVALIWAENDDALTPAARERLAAIASKTPELRVLSPSEQEARWEGGIVATVANSNAADPDHGVWMPRSLAVEN